jgi:hypothetical protein
MAKFDCLFASVHFYLPRTDEVSGNSIGRKPHDKFFRRSNEDAVLVKFEKMLILTDVKTCRTVLIKLYEQIAQFRISVNIYSF